MKSNSFRSYNRVSNKNDSFPIPCPSAHKSHGPSKNNNSPLGRKKQLNWSFDIPVWFVLHSFKGSDIPIAEH